MLKRLRIQFVAVMMVIVTLTLFLVLGMVCRFTAKNLEADSLNMMKIAAEHPFKPERPGTASAQTRLSYFILQISRTGEVIVLGEEFFDLSDQDFLRELETTVFNSPDHSGTIDAYALRFYRATSPMGHILVFASTASEQSTLRNLVRTCIFIGVVCFAAFFAVSLLLARWMVRPVERAWEEQRQFVSDASHELKTPLTVIMTNAELLPEPENQFTQNILVMAQQMRQLVERLLELARADSGRDQITLTPLDLSALAERALLPFEPLFFEQGLSLSSAIQPGLWVKGSETHLRQVLDILLDNAQKYADPGGAVTMTLERRGRHICRLTLSNPGPELSRTDRNNIFKRFYRADQARSRDGSFGLGLAIARNITAAHRGRIWADSWLGIITFTVELPLSTAEKNGTA